MTGRSVPERGTVMATTKLVKAMRRAAASKPTSSGAVLGTVIEGDTPTLTVRLDAGQEVPQCMGDILPVDTRVLCFWVNEGHDLAVLHLSDPGPVG